uniref:Acyltransferase 3 domain-containing protein n=1 Tax=Dendroctonus ponderosae TaxID=77166 RepID=A0AAR5Q6D8_DENPD
MTYFWTLFVCLGFVQYVQCYIDVTDARFRELPPIFHIDDDSVCATYCKASILIQLEDSKSNSHWQVIEQTIKHPRFYNHNELFHAICLEKFCPQREDEKLDLKGQIDKCYSRKYGSLGLNFSVSQLNCSVAQYSATAVDNVALVCSVMYILLIAAATYQHYKKPLQGPGHPVCQSFSLIANWRKLCTPNTRPDFQKLKFIQGIRFYNMLLVIFCHTQCSYIGGYVSNTEYFEQVYRNPIRLFFGTLSVFLVQTFFLLSAFLLSFHVCQSMTVYTQSKWKYVLVTFLNRYLRILPPLLVMIMMASTSWIIANFPGPLRSEFSNKEFERCRKNWWTNLIFINNHYNENEMCYFITWYLAADTQLYLVSLLILLLIWKFPKQRKLFLTAAISIGVLMPAVVCWKYGLDFIYRLTPENSKRNNFRSFQFNAIYTSTYTNTASYMVGLALGCFYYSLEKGGAQHKKYFNRKSTSLLSAISIAMLLVASQDYSRPISVVLAGLVKPCYALGIGIGIISMSQQANCLIRRICEWKPVIFMGNFTYSTYVVQFGLVFYRTTAARKLLHVSDFVLLTSFVQDALLSIFCGFLLHIMVEMPALQLQKMYIPQIRPINYPERCKSANGLNK